MGPRIDRTVRVASACAALALALSASLRAQVALGSLDHPDSFMRDRFGGAMASDVATLVVGEHGGASVQEVYVRFKP